MLALEPSSFETRRVLVIHAKHRELPPHSNSLKQPQPSIGQIFKHNGFDRLPETQSGWKAEAELHVVCLNDEGVLFSGSFGCIQ